MPDPDIREAEDLPARRALSEETVLSLVEPEQLGKPHKVELTHTIIKRYPHKDLRIRSRSGSPSARVAIPQ